jgi:hypothetical protein
VRQGYKNCSLHPCSSSCRELALGGLPAADVEQYAAARFAGAELPVGLVTLLVQRSREARSS